MPNQSSVALLTRNSWHDTVSWRLGRVNCTDSIFVIPYTSMHTIVSMSFFLFLFFERVSSFSSTANNIQLVNRSKNSLGFSVKKEEEIGKGNYEMGRKCHRSWSPLSPVVEAQWSNLTGLGCTDTARLARGTELVQ